MTSTLFLEDNLSCFPQKLPPERLGTKVDSLEAFRVQQYQYQQQQHHQQRTIQEEYAFIVVTDSIKQRILLGLKQRGFGIGMYNVFAGKIQSDNNETPLDCARRELAEESGLKLPSSNFHKIGIMHYTFSDTNHEMVAHVFHVDVGEYKSTETQSEEFLISTKRNHQHNHHHESTATTTAVQQHNPIPVDTKTIRACDEIIPQWFDHWLNDVPLDNMFADDSLWLTQYLLEFSKEQTRLFIDGWFHYKTGGQKVNSIACYYMDIAKTKRSSSSSSSSSSSKESNGKIVNVQETDTLQNSLASTGAYPTARQAIPFSITENSNATSSPPLLPLRTKTTKQFTLEQRLFHALKSNKIQNPSTKEFDEAWAFAKAVQNMFGNNKYQFDVIIDVAGGHGAVAALLLILTKATRAVVIDPACVGNGGVERAWCQDFFTHKQSLEYRHEDLRTGLPAELECILETVSPERVLVVACHACQHLSDEILQIICCQFRGVHAAVMPCCQRDTSPGFSWKQNSKRLGVPIDKTMDLLLAGKVMSWQDMGKIDSNDNDSANAYSYDVRMKIIDDKITPQNRIICCKAIKDQDFKKHSDGVEAAHERLAVVYNKAHRHSKTVPTRKAKTSTSKTTKTTAMEELSRNGTIPEFNVSGDDDCRYRKEGQWQYYYYQVGGMCALIGFACGFWLASSHSVRPTR